MTNDSKAGSSIDELELQRKVNALQREIHPERDLWQGIERSLTETPQKRPVREHLLPASVAASVFMAAAALLLSLIQFQSNHDVAKVPPRNADHEARVVSQFLLTGELGTTGAALQASLGTDFPEVRRIDPELRAEIYQNLVTLAEARTAIYREIQKQPGDFRLHQMLTSVQAQERELLQQDFTRQGRSL